MLCSMVPVRQDIFLKSSTTMDFGWPAPKIHKAADLFSGLHPLCPSLCKPYQGLTDPVHTHLFCVVVVIT